MRRHRFLQILALGICMAVALPVPAWGAQEKVLLCYGASYDLAGVTCAHHGADLAATAGEAAFSFVSGEVSFSGRIPADAGGSVLAVTVRTDDGMLVTLHPLTEVWVRQGESVVVGDGLGMVAATGDASVAESHLHLSARRDGAYVDPSFLIVGAEPEMQDPAPLSEATEPAPFLEGSPLPGLSASTQGAGASSPVYGCGTVPTAAEAPVPAIPSQTVGLISQPASFGVQRMMNAGVPAAADESVLAALGCDEAGLSPSSKRLSGRWLGAPVLGRSSAPEPVTACAAMLFAFALAVARWKNAAVQGVD
ncbi:MAG: peptidoglycan DD-metalloendopeptidase family protein [Coriobacteriia bacterium]|nr:peptidoglycan DD-metalloendopeptidase family protein [Coriobacteriia bacterium]